jgi:hypothetical protein
LEHAIPLNSSELLQLRGNGICDTDLWGYYTPAGFCPVKISTALHRAFQARTFELDSLIPPEERQNFVDGRHPNNANVLLDGIFAHPFVREFSHLLDLGFLPMRIASKLGEMQRAGACRHKYSAFRPKLFKARNPRWRALRLSHADILGFPCYLGNSEHANVVYRGDDFDAASNINGLHHRVVIGKLLLLLQSFPVELNGLPVGAQWYKHGKTYTSLKTTLKCSKVAYPQMCIESHDVCLLVINAWLDPNTPTIYLHPKPRTGKHAGDVGKIVDCPFSIGGAGTIESLWGAVTLNINHTPIE